MIHPSLVPSFGVVGSPEQFVVSYDPLMFFNRFHLVDWLILAIHQLAKGGKKQHLKVARFGDLIFLWMYWGPKILIHFDNYIHTHWGIKIKKWKFIKYIRFLLRPLQMQLSHLPAGQSWLSFLLWNTVLIDVLNFSFLLGIGGFMVRQRSRTGQGKTKRSLSRKDSSGSVSEQLPGRDEGKDRNLVCFFVVHG